MRLPVLQLCFLIGLISTVGCSTYKGERYTHKPTNKFASAMVASRYKRASSFIRKAKAPVIVIPRFREFSTDFSTNHAYAYFVTKNQNVEIKLKSVAISTSDREAETEIVLKSFKPQIVMLESPIQETEKTLDYPYKLIKVFSSNSSVKASDWNNEDELNFTVTYSVDDGPEITEIFKMEKSEYTDIAWPT